MIFLESIRIALEQIWSNKLRAALTLLGMLIGVGSVIGIVSIGEGMRQMVTDEFGKLGGDRILYVFPQSMVQKDGRWIDSPHYKPLTMDDLYRVERASERIAAVLPSMEGSAELRYRKTTFQGSLVATLPTHATAYNWEVARGRFLRDIDLKKLDRVAVIGSKVREDLFGRAPYMGREIKLNGQRFTVIGLMDERKLFGDDWGDQVLIPITTAQRRLFGRKFIGALIAHANTSADVPLVIPVIKNTLRQRHGPEADYQIISGKSILEQIEQTILIMKLVIGGIAGISLLVGGIGIMNIMLVSVAERTREIGIRKALGAKPTTLLWQFILEAVALSVTGGLLGVATGYGLGEGISRVIAHYSEQAFPSIVSPDATIFALGLSIAIGLFFGIYPAARASRLDPVDALRAE
ncbi:MAG: ABC transporter permease [Candidatus Latescibacteria bacterium]|nr:ABC transporter permease [Candidatus Latescibacterota bacterium]